MATRIRGAQIKEDIAGNALTVTSGILDVQVDGSTIEIVDDTLQVKSDTSYVANEATTGAINGSNTVFNLLNTPVSGTVTVYLNGLQQKPSGEDYVILGNQITFIKPPVVSDLILCNYFVSLGSVGGIPQHTHVEADITDSKRGAQPIDNGADSVSVTFTSAFPNIDYLVIVTLENIVDSTASIYSYDVTAKSTTGFTVSFSGEIDSENYKLNWVAQKY